VKLVADVALVAERSVLLVRYEDVSRYDGQRGWFLPDDYLRRLEHPDDSARRILGDQAGVATAKPRLGEIESFGDGDWHLVFHYVLELDRKPDVSAGENVKDAEWFPMNELPPERELAHHGWARQVLDRLAIA
jgi:ADP-ribose pyrophosphatase YjhB (NUDIX family)